MTVLRLWGRMNMAIVRAAHHDPAWQKQLWRKWRRVLRRRGVSGV
jgi:hypothetical protein